MTRTAEELKNRIMEAIDRGYDSITVTMKCNGDDVVITPCAQVMKITSFDQIEWFLIDSPSVNLCGSDKIEKVAEDLRNYAKLIEEDKKAVEDLKAHIRKYGENSDWDFVSDYHKDIFGHRPHVGTAQLIAWAHSNSNGSARMYHEANKVLF